MEGWIVLGLILIVIAYLFGRIGFAVEEDKERSEYAKTNETIDKAINAEDNKTRNLVINTLKEIGCQPEVDDKDRICFKYQGEEFFIDADNDYLFVTLWDTWWLCVDLDNANVEHLKEAINLNNIRNIVSTVYSIDEDNENIKVIKQIFNDVTDCTLSLGYGDGVSDNNIIVPQCGIPVICLGPTGGNMHAANEWVDIEEIKTVLRICLLYTSDAADE